MLGDRKKQAGLAVLRPEIEELRPNVVLPVPQAPVSRTLLPAGMPPLRMMSSPSMPVRHLGGRAPAEVPFFSSFGFGGM
jgi:hypothetical protein